MRCTKKALFYEGLDAEILRVDLEATTELTSHTGHRF